jgi:phytoene dehydrogenase-like protein
MSAFFRCRLLHACTTLEKEGASMKVVVIGAGIAGLSAACYARMNGYEAEVFESHTLPGGMCSTWKRGDFLFDGCIHWLSGSGPRSAFHAYWKELGVLENRPIIDHDVFYRFLGSDGRQFSLYADPARLERHIVELSPADAEPAALLRRLVTSFASRSLLPDKPMELLGPLDIARLVFTMMPVMKDLGFAQKTTVGEFSRRFKDPLVRESLPLTLSAPGGSLIALAATLADFHNRTAGFPRGGSLEVARAIEGRLHGLGGRIRYGARVQRVIVENGRAVGIALEDGSTERADTVISAADLRQTQDRLLGGAWPHPVYDALFAEAPLYPSGMQVSLGLSTDFTEHSDCAGFFLQLKEPRMIGGTRIGWLSLTNYHFDRSLSPGGGTVVTALVPADYDHWANLRADKAAYRAAKAEVLAEVVAILDRQFPGLAAAVVQSDVATPATYHRYTGSYRGSYMTWIMTPVTTRKFRLIPKTIPGLEGFYQAGMWVMAPGGLPTAAKTARDVVQLMCRRDGKKFRAAMP